MREIIYDLLQSFLSSTLFVFDKIRIFTLKLISIPVNSAYNVCTWIAVTALRLVDADQYDVEKEIYEQRNLINELKIIETLIEIKDNAIANKGWSDEFTSQLNSCATALNVHCGWEPVQVRDYLANLLVDIKEISIELRGQGENDIEDDDIQLK